jgi:hypothetical protein
MITNALIQFDAVLTDKLNQISTALKNPIVQGVIVGVNTAVAPEGVSVVEGGAAATTAAAETAAATTAAAETVAATTTESASAPATEAAFDPATLVQDLMDALDTKAKLNHIFGKPKHNFDLTGMDQQGNLDLIQQTVEENVNQITAQGANYSKDFGEYTVTVRIYVDNADEPYIDTAYVNPNPVNNAPSNIPDSSGSTAPPVTNSSTNSSEGTGLQSLKKKEN